jgi:hypothetical protein
VRVDDRLGDREAEPAALDCLCRGGLAAAEALEEVAELVRPHADPGIRHDEADAAVRAGRVDRDVAAGRGELERVREQVVDHLGEAAAAARQPDPGHASHPEPDPAWRGERAGCFDRFGGELVEVDEGCVERELPVVDPGDEEEVLDEAEQPVGVAVDDGDGAVPFGRAGLVCAFFAEERQVAEDRGQRSAQFVRYLRDEGVLGLRASFDGRELGRSLRLELDGLVVAKHEAGHAQQDEREQDHGCDQYDDVARSAQVPVREHQERGRQTR